MVVSGALLVSHRKDMSSLRRGLLTVYPGGGREATHELHTNVPAIAERGQLLRLQRYFQA